MSLDVTGPDGLACLLKGGEILEEKPIRRRGRPPKAPSQADLAKLAAHRLKQRLELDSLSTGDLLKLLQMGGEAQPDPAPKGPWVLKLRGEE